MSPLKTCFDGNFIFFSFLFLGRNYAMMRLHFKFSNYNPKSWECCSMFTLVMPTDILLFQVYCYCIIRTMFCLFWYLIQQSNTNSIQGPNSFVVEYTAHVQLDSFSTCVHRLSLFSLVLMDMNKENSRHQQQPWHSAYCNIITISLKCTG